MQSGAPVIATDIPVHREVGGTAALYANPKDPAAWASLMQSLIGGDPQRSAASLTRAREYSWQRTAQAFRALYARCL
jgi:glycosyltransferase involved in cell wall biosynthesis